MKELTSLVESRYGLEIASLERLAGYEDENHRLTTAAGARFVLKRANPATPDSVLDAQDAVLEHLAREAPDLSVPRLRRTLEGAARIEHDGRRVRLVSWLEGTLLARLESPDLALFEALGAFLGRVDRALEGVAHAGLSRPMDWDLLEVLRVCDDLSAIADRDRRRVLEHLLLELELDTGADLARLPRAVIHNDANDHNVLAAAPDRITGLFDFGDVLETARAGEVAVAAAYAMLERDDPLEVLARMAAGYRREHDLTEAELAALYPLVCARLALSVVHGARGLARDPENTYLGLHAEPAWRLIARLLGTHPEAAEARLRRAAGLDAPRAPASTARALEARGRHLGTALALHYAEPLKICRGVMQHLYDEDGRAYLDLVNNVCHVGHAHPRVVRAGARQMSRLNTNTRYLHDEIARYAERLTARLPAPLEVCFLVCSGSEANELALRLAAAHSGRREVLVVEHAYHGNTSGLIDVSPYKFAGPGGAGAPEHVRVVPAPDTYRGPHRGQQAAACYAREVEAAVAARAPGAFLCEPLMSCAGHLVPPAGWLPAAFDAVRRAGGVCIADEVQVGFGRAGSHFWAFETHGVVPDVVTLGKPIGNGHPLAAVVTTRAIAAAFDNGMEYFNTFGGNPVSCAIGNAVLDVIEGEGLQQRALELGARFREGLLALDHPAVGDVRGRGLFLGVDLVRDRDTREPDAALAAALVERLKAAGVLISTEGPGHNVIKIKPPLVLSEADVEHAVVEFGRALGAGVSGSALG